MKTGKLKMMLHDNEMTQGELAEKLDIGEDTMTHKIKKRKDFWLKEAKICADLFGVTVDELFFYD